MEWFKLEQPERIKEVYSKFTIKSFWDWWSDKENKVMEVRIKDIPLIKQTAKIYNLEYSMSGVYVNTAEQLKQVIGFVRDKATIWFGINPRKKNWNTYGNKSFGSGPRGGSSDANISEIDFIFCDIDRIDKQDEATKEDLEHANMVADKLLEKFGKAKWNKGFVKICSGNGVQLIIKLDYPLLLPSLEFKKILVDNKEVFVFVDNEKFSKLKILIKEALGKEMVAYIKKFRSDYNKNYGIKLNAEIDKSGFNINRVAALPFTKNFKHDGFTWRGIVELKNGINEGLADYLLARENNLNLYNSINTFDMPRNKSVQPIKSGTVFKNELVRFMLDNDLPYGNINNKVWFQLKCLLRDSSIDQNSDEFKELVKKLEVKYKGVFSRNYPDNKFSFNKEVVNSYCYDNMMKKLYDLETIKDNKENIFLNIPINNNTLEILEIDRCEKKEYILKEEDSFKGDIFKFKNKIKEPGTTDDNGIDVDDYYNKQLLYNFLIAFIDKHGKDKFNYCLKEGLFNYYINFN